MPYYLFEGRDGKADSNGYTIIAFARGPKMAKKKAIKHLKEKGRDDLIDDLDDGEVYVPDGDIPYSDVQGARL